MGLFSNAPRAGGIMDVIRCDEPSYLVWKWHPAGSKEGNNNRENAIRWGSSLRVREGEVAVFVYSQPNGVMEDFITGPWDQIIKTDNFPVLASIIGLAYQGGSPFQAEVYFINLAKVIQVPFAVPYFDLYDPRFPDLGVPTAVRGTLSFNIADYHEFIKLHKLADFNLDTFQKQVKDAISRYVKNVVLNVPEENGIPVVQIERKISEINDLVQKDVKERLERDFGVNVTAVDISAIELDKTSDGYAQLKAVTQDLLAATVKVQTEVNIKNLQDMQRINAEEMQYAQRKQTQTANMAAYQLEQQAAVGIAGANALGQMGANGAVNMSGGGMNPAAMMAGMAMGGSIGQNMAGMMNGMFTGMNQPQDHAQAQAPAAPSPLNTPVYHVAINGVAAGPYGMQELSQMVATGQLLQTSLVWKPGMNGWVPASSIQELNALFSGTVPPPLPPV